MADIATAFVLVKPKLDDFAGDLKKGVDAAVKTINKNPPKVLIKVGLDEPSLKLVKDRLAGISGRTVPFVPSVSDADVASIKERLKTLATDVPIEVDVRASAESIALLRKQLGAITNIPVDVTPVASTADREKVTAELGRVPANIEPVISADDRKKLSQGLEGVKASVVPTVSADEKKALQQRIGTIKVPVSFTVSADEKKALVAKAGAPKVPVTFSVSAEARRALRDLIGKITGRVGVSLHLAAGAREKLRQEIAAITGAQVPVTAIVTGAPVERPAGQPTRRRAAADVGQTEGLDKATQASARLRDALDRAAVADFVLEQAQKELNDTTTDSAVLTARLNQVSREIEASINREAIAVRLANAELRERVVLQRQALIAVKAPLAERAGAVAASTGTQGRRAAEAVATTLAEEKRITAELASVQKLAAKEALEYAAAKDAVARANALVQATEKQVGRASDIARKVTTEQTAELRENAQAHNQQAVAAKKSLLAQQEIAGLSERFRRAATTGEAADTPLRRLQLRESAIISTLEASRVARERFAQVGLIEEAERLAIIEAQNRAILIQIQEEREAAQQSARRTRQVAAGSRGLATSLLSFAGLRAQVLAASGGFIAGVAAATAFARSLQQFAAFETTLNVLQETTGATAQQMEQASETARQLGADLTLPGVTAADAAEAMSSLARAGLSVEESLAATRGVLELATAANIANAEATTLVASALNAFSIAGAEASHVVDVYANAANSAQGEITDFGIAMQQVAAVASQTGVSFEDTTALLTLLARAGLRGSDAGTSLRTALLRLVSPTQEARNIIESLGVQIRGLTGEVRPEVFADFAAATAELSPNLRDAFASIVFGQDAIRAAALIGREGAQGLRGVQEALKQTGTGADLAAARTQGLAGAFQNIANQAATTGAEIGKLFAPAVQSVAENLASAISGLGGVIRSATPAIQTAARAIADIVNAVGGIGTIVAGVAAFKAFQIALRLATAASVAFTASLVKVRTAVAGTAAVQAAANMTTFARAAAVARGSVTALGSSLLAFAGGPANLAAIAIGAITAAVIYFTSQSSSAEKALDRLAEGARNASTAFQANAAAVDALNAAQAALPDQEAAIRAADAAVAQAAADLSRSASLPGTAERTALELALAEAIDRRTAAQDAYNKTLDQLPGLQTAVTQTQQDELNLLEDLRAQLQAVRGEAIKSAIVDVEFGGADLTAQALSVENFAEGINKIIKEQTDLAPIVRLNLSLLAKFTERLRRQPDEREIDFILNNEDFKRSVDDIIDVLGLGITDARAAAEQGGRETGEALVGGFFDTIRRAQQLGRELTGALVNLELLGGVEAEGEAADVARAEIDRILDELNRLGAEGQVAIRQARGQLIPVLDETLRSMIAEFTGFDELVEKEVPDAILKGIERLAALGGPGKAALKKLGEDYMEAMAEGVEDGKQQVIDAVESAKSNLVSLGESLGGQVSDLIDAGPLGQQIRRLESQLESRGVRRQRLGLVEQLKEARDAVKEAQIEVSPLARELADLEKQLERIRSIGEKTDLARALRDAREALERARASLNIAPATAQQERAQARFLRPFREEVEVAARRVTEAKLENRIKVIGDEIDRQKEALKLDPLVVARKRVKELEQAIRDFDDEQLIESLRKTAEAQKEAVTDGINNIIAQFNTGGLSLAQAQSRIAKLVGSKTKPWQDAGFALGQAFGLKFRETALATITQMEELVLGPQRAGTTGVTPKVVSTREAEKELLKKIQEQDAARVAIQKAIQNGITGPQGTNAILRDIRDGRAGRRAKSLSPMERQELKER